jgi:hypothetical protein
MAAYVILDLSKVEGLDWNSVSDFVAIAVLFNAQMDAAYPANTTILSLIRNYPLTCSGRRLSNASNAP